MHYGEAIEHLIASSRDTRLMECVAAIETQMNQRNREVAKLLGDLERCEQALTEYAGTMCFALGINPPGENAVRFPEQVADQIRKVIDQRRQYQECLESIAEPMPEVGDWKSRAQVRQLRAFTALHPLSEQPGPVCITDPA